MRIEKDSMGEMLVPDDALYGASTERALRNSSISGIKMPKAFNRAIGLVKYAAAVVNEELGKLPKEKAQLIERAALEVYEGKLDDQFPLEIFQTGSATSSNMNANEVIANRVSQMVGEPIGSKVPVHPNDDVNMGQSSNDTMPTVLHVSVALALKNELIPALELLQLKLEEKAEAWKGIVKIGRTHLMDATPLTLGQEFSGYAAQVRKGVERARKGIDVLRELAIGGTAVGTGINCHPEFAGKVIAILREKTGIDFIRAKNAFEAQAGRDDSVEVAGYLSTIAASLNKIASDIRLMGSGPRSGIGELILPAIQPGSSIMPGKVNPVLSEMLVQVAIYVIGLCEMVVLCGRDGHFELNVTIPLIAHALHRSIDSLSHGARFFAERCVAGLEANEMRCKELVDRSLMLVTALNPYIGYDKAAYVAKKAHLEGKTLREVVLEEGLLDEATVKKVLDPKGMVGLG